MKTRTYFLMIAFVLTTSFGITSCVKNNDENMPPNNGATVTMLGNTFFPGRLEVPTGTVVTWINNDNEVHTVTADDRLFDSGDLAPGDTFTFTFAVAGTFTYHCNHHAVTGTVVVVAP